MGGDETFLENVESENEVSTRYRTIHIESQSESIAKARAKYCSAKILVS